jgi:peroxiredoxin
MSLRNIAFHSVQEFLEMLVRRPIVSLCLGVAIFYGNVFGGTPSVEYASLDPELVAVPQNVLNLLHTPEIQKELDIDAEQLASWEKTLREIDSRWWPSRILPLAPQRKLVAELESEAVLALESLLGSNAICRLRQIELQSQSSRILVRPEIIKFLELNAEQVEKISELFAKNDRIRSELSTPNGKEDSEKTKAYAQAKQAEPSKALQILSATQATRLRQVLGEPFATAKLERIYPLAPEFIDSGYWTSTERPTLESLRGQVVIVHVYAFQCHNCVANFGHYKRWDETLKKKGVRVVGIQSPETSAEKDPEKVQTAATKDGFKFPVLIDVDMKNWKAWGNTMWPTVYVIDKNGYIRFWWQGELNWQGATVDQKIDQLIDRLLSES